MSVQIITAEVTTEQDAKRIADKQLKKKIIEEQSGKAFISNELIWKKMFSLTTQQLKMLLYMISHITEDSNFTDFITFDIQTFCRVCGFDCTQGYYYKALKKDLLLLKSKSEYRKMPNNHEVTVSWLAKVDIYERAGQVSVMFDSDLKDILFNLKSCFSVYCLEFIIPMSCKYAIRLYMLLKSYEWQGKKMVFDLDELKKRIDAENYEAFDLKRRALTPAIDEINAYTDIKVELNVLKSGRSVTGYAFQISTPAEDEISKRRERRYEKLEIKL